MRVTCKKRKFCQSSEIALPTTTSFDITSRRCHHSRTSLSIGERSPTRLYNAFPLTSLSSSTFSSPLTSSLRRHPFTYFGLPFILVLVTSSFALSGFTQTRYDLRDQRVTAMTKEEELGMKKGRRKWDVREEYYVSSQSLCRARQTRDS